MKMRPARGVPAPGERRFDGRVAMQAGSPDLWVCLMLMVTGAHFCGGQQLWAQTGQEAPGRVIRSVRVEGNRVVPTERILQNLKCRAGARFSEELANEDARQIIVMPEIIDLQWRVIPVGDEVDLIFKVTESQKIVSVEFVGNKHVKQEDLAEAVNFKEGAFKDLFRIRNGIGTIEEVYRKKGYYSVRVSVDEGFLDRELKVAYTIVEGPKLRIKKVTFLNNRSISKRKLKGQIKARRYVFIFNKGLMDETQLEQDRLAIASYYHSEGFLDARVYWRPEFNDDRTRVRIEFVIEEGEQYRLSELQFKGNDLLSEEELRSMLKFKEGDVLTRERQMLSVRALEGRYGKEGYIIGPDPLYTQIRFESEFTDRTGEVVGVFNIREGNPFSLGRLVIQGNVQTQDKVVRREFDRYDFSPGTKYDTSVAEQARRRLQGSGLFQDVRVEPIGADPNERDALVNVTEKMTGLMTFGVGLGSNNGAFGQFSVQEQNFDISKRPSTMKELWSGESFRGGGQRLSLNLMPGTRETRGRINFREPYLNDQPYYLDFDLFLFRRFQESYLERRRGGRITFGHHFEKDWDADIGFRIGRVLVNDLDEGRLIPGDNSSPKIITAPQDVQDVEGGNTLTSIRLGVSRDRTDSRFRPTEGYRLNSSWEQYGAMGGEFSFASLAAGATIFKIVHEDLAERRTVWASRLRGNTIIGDAPMFERFYAGGIGSVRGFDYRGISPRAGRDDDPIGSDYLVLAGTELTWPLYEDVMYGKVFLDSAMIEEGPVRVAIGFGLELVVPQLFQQVPMQFNIGVPVNEDDLDDEEVFSFSMGLFY